MLLAGPDACRGSSGVEQPPSFNQATSGTKTLAVAAVAATELLQKYSAAGYMVMIGSIQSKFHPVVCALGRSVGTFVAPHFFVPPPPPGKNAFALSPRC